MLSLSRLLPLFCLQFSILLPELMAQTSTASFLNGALPVTDQSSATEISADNPFAADSTLPFKAPPFDKIRIEHYQPAFHIGMKQQLAEIKAIADNKDAPTFENTIVPIEQSGRLLNRVQQVFFNMTSSHTNEDLQNIQSEMAPLLAAHSDNINLNRKLFARVEQLFE